MHFWIYPSHPVKSKKKKKHQQFLNDYWIEILFVIILHLYLDKLVLVHVFMFIWYIIQLYLFRKAEWLKKNSAFNFSFRILTATVGAILQLSIWDASSENFAGSKDSKEM